MAPLRTTRVKACSEPWMNADILAAMKARDKKKSKLAMLPNNERLQSKLSSLKNQRNKLRNRVTTMIKTAKCNYINAKAEENKNNPCGLWKVLK